MDSLFERSGFDFSDIMDADSEFIPLLSSEEEEQMAAEKLPEVLAILPLKNTVLFPGVVIPITVSRDKSIRLVREVYKKSKIIGVVSQKDPSVEEPGFEDLNKIGSVAQIIKVLQMPDGNTTVIIQGKKRFELKELVEVEPYFKARVDSFDQDEKVKYSQKFKALISTIKDLAIQIVKLSPNVPSEAAFAIKNIEMGYNSARAYVEEALKQNDYSSAVRLMNEWDKGLIKSIREYNKTFAKYGYQDQGGLMKSYYFTWEKRSNMLFEPKTKRTPLEKRLTQ